jgi:hypothetical protein
MSQHHIVPRSRCKELGINPKDKRNIVEIDDRLHDLYHKLFKNMTPNEILYWLAEYFWGGRYDLTKTR